MKWRDIARNRCYGRHTDGRAAYLKTQASRGISLAAEADVMKLHFSLQSELEKPCFSEKKFLKVFFRFLKVFKVLMYEDRTQNSEPEVHEEYLIHNTTFPC